MKNDVVAVWVWTEQAWSSTVLEEWEKCEMQWMKVRSHGVEPDMVGHGSIDGEVQDMWWVKKTRIREDKGQRAE